MHRISSKLDINKATHSNTLAWKIPGTEEPGGLQSMGSLRVGHDCPTSLSLFTFMHWRRKWQPLPCSCLENPRDGGAWWAAICGVSQSQTQLKQLSSSRARLYHSYSNIRKKTCYHTSYPIGKKCESSFKIMLGGHHSI